MPISSNINQANFDAQTRSLNEQEAQRSQASAQDFSAQESQKTRDYDLNKYNLSEGDTFLDKNVAVVFDETQRSGFSDALAVTYSNAQEELLSARDMITSGDTKKRIEGQARMTKANSSLKKLGEDLMILEKDTEAVANDDNIPDANSQLAKTLYKNNVEGTTKIVASTEATKGEGDENQGRYIQYIDEDKKTKFISIDAYQKILKGVTKRQDVNGWITSTKENLETDENYRGENIDGKKAAVQGHIDNYLSDPSVVRALSHQLGVEGKDAVSAKLSEMLVGAKDKTVYRTPTSSGAGKTLTPGQADEANAASQRNYDLTQALNPDKTVALNWLNSNLASKAVKQGAYKDKVIANNGVSLSGNNIKIQFEDGSTREIPYQPEQLNNLLNEVVYTLDDARSIPYAKAGASQPKNFGGVFGTTTPSAVETNTEDELTNVIDAATNKTLRVSESEIEGFIGQLLIKFPQLNAAGLKEEKNYTKKNGIKFQNKEYDVVNSADGMIELKKAMNTYIKTLKGKGTQTTGVGSKYK